MVHVSRRLIFFKSNSRTKHEVLLEEERLHKKIHRVNVELDV